MYKPPNSRAEFMCKKNRKKYALIANIFGRDIGYIILYKYTYNSGALWLILVKKNTTDTSRERIEGF